MPVLTPDQGRAVDTQKSLWIHASAGSGKTSVLTQRLARILLEGGASQEVLCLTFTKKAAQEMTDRIQGQIEQWAQSDPEILSKELSTLLGALPTSVQIQRALCLAQKVRESPLNIQTFHSFCHDLITLFPLESQSGTNLHILETHHSLNLWKQSFDSVIEPSKEAQSPLHHAIKRLSCKDLHLEETARKVFLSRLLPSSFVQDLLPKEQEDHTALFEAIMPRYQSSKGEDLDMDDLLLRALHLFQDDSLSGWVMHSLNRRFSHLLLDEAQDTSHIQWQIFRFMVESIMSDSRRTVFVVGDPKQSIYSFQGASLKDFFAMKKFVHQWVVSHGGRFEEISFDVSFRSCAPILCALNQTFGQLDLLESPFQCHRAHDDQRTGCVHFLHCSEQEGQSHFWVDRIQSWLDNPFFLSSQGRNLEKRDIMILLPRRTSFFSSLQDDLLARGFIPPLSFAVEQNKTLEVLLCLGKWILDCHNDEALASILQICFSQKWKEIVFYASYDRKKRSIWSHIRIMSKTQDIWKSTVDTLKRWRDQSGLLTMSEWYAQVVWGSSGLGCWSCNGQGALDTVDAFFDALDRHMVRGQFPTFIQAVQGDNKMIVPLTKGHDGVQLMTIHGAKGLQAPVVIMPDVPPPLRKETPEYWRLLYVAMTRAQDRLYIASRKDQKGWMPVLDKAFKNTDHLDTTGRDPVHVSRGTEQDSTIQDSECPDWMTHFSSSAKDKAVGLTQESQKPILFSDLRLRRWGTALHQILDELPLIDSKQWFHKSTRFLVKEGMSSQRARSWTARLVRLLHREDLRPLFFESLSERSIKTPTGVVRPDRLLIRDRQVWIVDLKSSRLDGSLPPLAVRDRYAAQMRSYGQALQILYPNRPVRLSILWLATGVLEDVLPWGEEEGGRRKEEGGSNQQPKRRHKSLGRPLGTLLFWGRSFLFF